MEKRILLLLCFFAAVDLFAQHTMDHPVPPPQSQRAFFGLGAGLDYGGLGLKAEYQPVERLGLFGGFGYNLADPAYNAGMLYTFLPAKNVQPFVTGMYGYNAAVIVRPYVHETFYGFSAGAGCHIFDKKGKNKFTVSVLYPFRTQAFHDYYEEIKQYYVMKNTLLPVTFSLGYHFRLGKPDPSTKN